MNHEGKPKFLTLRPKTEVRDKKFSFQDRFQPKEKETYLKN